MKAAPTAAAPAAAAAPPLAQIIDYEGNFQPDVLQYVQGSLGNRGFAYSVVTVLGCQSSGKSTLLNALFATEFEVMDATRGRSQTTKGLWLGRSSSNDTLIIDVEGTDSKERGEDRLTFEHRAALFSLALADVVIVNMWYHDLGRYTASNYGLLKTVLAVNLELFQQEADSPKTVMLFVIRDYLESQTPLTKLQDMIQADIRQIWGEITKPPHLEHSRADDFFTFKTVGMPSKLLEPEKFDRQVTVLREKYFSECRPPQYSRSIPADGFSFYAQSIWTMILQSSELDIPSQKEMLATFRCDELRSSALREALEELPSVLAAAREGRLSVSNCDWAQRMLTEALELYDGPASRYHSEVCRKTRTQLVTTLNAEFQKVLDAHFGTVRQRLVRAANDALQLHCPSATAAGEESSSAAARFGEVVYAWKSNALTDFDSTVTAFTLKYPALGEKELSWTMTFNVEPARQAFEEALDALAERQREKLAADLMKRLRDHLLDHINSEVIEALFLSPDLTPISFWAAIAEQICAAKASADAMFRESWLGLQTSENAVEEAWERVAYATAVEVTRDRLGRVCEWLQNHIVARFQVFFAQDEQGAPRQWQNLKPEAIKDFFLQAKTKALQLIKILESAEQSMPKLCDGQISSSPLRQLLTTAQKEAVMTKATRQMQQICREAQLIQATGLRGANIPWWMWVVLLCLGYNEMTAVLFSPVALVLILAGCAVTGMAYVTGNFRLPVELSRHAAGMVASSLISVLKSVQSVAEPAPPAAPLTKRPGTASTHASP